MPLQKSHVGSFHWLHEDLSVEDPHLAVNDPQRVTNTRGRPRNTGTFSTNEQSVFPRTNTSSSRVMSNRTESNTASLGRKNTRKAGDRTGATSASVQRVLSNFEHNGDTLASLDEADAAGNNDEMVAPGSRSRARASRGRASRGGASRGGASTASRLTGTTRSRVSRTRAGVQGAGRGASTSGRNRAPRNGLLVAQEARERQMEEEQVEASLAQSNSPPTKKAKSAPAPKGRVTVNGLAGATVEEEDGEADPFEDEAEDEIIVVLD